MPNEKHRVKLAQKICEHLKTYKKYRTLENAWETLRDDYADLKNKYDALEQAKKIQKEEFRKQTDEYIEELIRLKLKLKEVKKK